MARKRIKLSTLATKITDFREVEEFGNHSEIPDDVSSVSELIPQADQVKSMMDIFSSDKLLD